MTKRVGGVVQIEPEAPAECELCGKTAELRPYGPKGERVCFECGMKDEAAARRGFAKMSEGASHATAPAEYLDKHRKQ